MAETYHLFDLRALPVQTVAVLAAGLPEAARIRRKMSGAPLRITDMLLAAILDGVNLLVWAGSKDAQRGRNRPKSVLSALSETAKPDSVMSFDSPAAFEAARARLIGGQDNGN